MGKIKNFFENRWDDLMLTVSSVTTRRKILDVIFGVGDVVFYHMAVMSADTR